LAYLTFNAADFVADAPVTDADLEKYYRRNRGNFEVVEQVHAAHILIKVPEDAAAETREQKRAKIDEILEKSRAGEDFAALAKRYSEDGSRSQGGDLGFFPRGRMVKPFENVAFSLPAGEISDVVTTQFGFHIIKVLEIREARVKPLEEVREEVTAGAKEQKALQLSFEKALDAYNLNRKGGSIEQAASDFNAEIEITPLFERNNPVPVLGSNPEIQTAAFALKQGELARPVRDGDTTYLIAVKEKQASYIPELAEVREQVINEFRAEQAKKLAEQAAQDSLANLEEGATIKQAARQTGGLVRTSESFAQANGDIIPGLGTSKELAEKAFELTPDNPLAPQVYNINNVYIVATLKEKSEADMGKLDEAKREELRTALVEQRKSEVVDALVEGLREQAEIVINLKFNKG